MEDVEEASKQANAYKFIVENNYELEEEIAKNSESNENEKNIENLQENKEEDKGFNKNVGTKGGKLSGGQK